MEFRPCIDIHNGLVKQIVGSSLQDEGDVAQENFVSKRNADFFAKFYAKDGLKGGHVIMLNRPDSPYYEKTKQQALLALAAYPGGLQIGGGITAENAGEFLAAGASHVIVTSYVFSDGKIDYDHLEKLVDAVGKEHVVLDLSCRRMDEDEDYYVVTDRWQKFTDLRLDHRTLDALAGFCDEFLVHGVDVEGKQSGMDEELVGMLGEWTGDRIITYAGGIRSLDDIERLRLAGKGKLDFTVGSALDLFGGSLSYRAILERFPEGQS